MIIKAILFDLDGTLADTALDLGFALNQMLIKRNLDIIPVNKVRSIVNLGVKGLLKLGFSIQATDKNFDSLRREYLTEYKKCFLNHSNLFTDIDELIINIDKLHIKWGIVTNKSKLFANKLVEKLNFSVPPLVVVSGDTTSEFKPSVKPMFYASNTINVRSINCIYVGDAKSDVEAGKNSGMKTVIAKWGYIPSDCDINSWGADYIISKPFELLNIIDKLII